LLGLSATISHTAIVWAIALVGLHFGEKFNAESTEPYFQLASAVLIIGVAIWMLLRTYREHQREKREADHDHYGHDSHDDTKRVDTGHGQTVEIEVFEQGVPPRFHLRFALQGRRSRPLTAAAVSIQTTRPDGSTQQFAFALRSGFLESVDVIPEPHEFTARLRLSHDDHNHDYDVVFEEHDHAHHEHAGLDVAGLGYQDAHELAHANDIRRRFASRDITTGQIVMFGLTGGLVPCPASITVLLLCLQLKQLSLGMVLVLCFSIGLALTMVASGTVAALSVRHVSKRWTGFGTLARRAPYVSSLLIILVGLYTGYLGWRGLADLA
jgi:nickel/cobalt exporter